MTQCKITMYSTLRTHFVLYFLLYLFIYLLLTDGRVVVIVRVLYVPVGTCSSPIVEINESHLDKEREHENLMRAWVQYVQYQVGIQ